MQHKFTIKGVPVYARNLPSGDMAVWHPFNNAVQAVVEPICRGRGYWQPEFRNWVIKAACTGAVLAELTKVGVTL